MADCLHGCCLLLGGCNPTEPLWGQDLILLPGSLFLYSQDFRWRVFSCSLPLHICSFFPRARRTSTHVPVIGLEFNQVLLLKLTKELQLHLQLPGVLCRESPPDMFGRWTLAASCLLLQVPRTGFMAVGEDSVYGHIMPYRCRQQFHR